MEMSDRLAIVNRIIAEHEVIRGHIKLAGDSVSDRESLAILKEAGSDWIPGRLDILVERKRRLQSIMMTLGEGLKNHFALEEGELPLLLGELLMQALLLDHQKIGKEIEQVNEVVAESRVNGLTREAILSTELRMQQAVNSMAHMIEEHAARETAILKMLRGVLEHTGQ